MCVGGGGGGGFIIKTGWRVFYLIRTPLCVNNVCYKVTQGTEKEVTFPWVDLRGNPQIEKEGKKKNGGVTKIFSKMRQIRGARPQNYYREGLKHRLCSF